jgi:hypothetical protein
MHKVLEKLIFRRRDQEIIPVALHINPYHPGCGLLLEYQSRGVILDLSSSTARGMSSFSLKLYGTEMQHCAEQVEELETSEFKKSLSENVSEYHASVKRKVVLVHALKEHGE